MNPTTRRALLAGAPVLTAATAAFAITMASETVAQKWERVRVNLGDYPDLTEAQWDHHFMLEHQILHGPITSRADAIAKLKLLEVRLGSGYSDHDPVVVADVARWLEAH